MPEHEHEHEIIDPNVSHEGYVTCATCDRNVVALHTGWKHSSD